MSGPSSPDVHQEGLSGKQNCFPRDLTLSVYCLKYKEHDMMFL